MEPLLYILTILTQATIEILRLFGNGGTSLPGLWIEKYAPWVISAYVHRFSQIIIITGTNGKTTTQILISHILRESGLELSSNSSGSNTFRGIASTIVSYGKPRSQNSILVLEVEEATMPNIAPYITPHKVVVTNFFRDQLDAYGELHKTIDYVRSAILAWPEAKLYLNADDEKVLHVAKGSANSKEFFSMGEFGKDFMYEHPSIDVASYDISLKCKSYVVNESFDTVSNLEFRRDGYVESLNVKSPLSGPYNIYNLMSSILVCKDLNVEFTDFQKHLRTLRTPFGRGEVINVNVGSQSFRFLIFLIKNPAGMTQVWNMIKDKIVDKTFLVALNDSTADGRDVSWIWDAKLTILDAKMPKDIFMTGSRALDMAIRFKYAGINIKESSIDSDISRTIKAILSSSNSEVIVMATYTAMNQVRDVLSTYISLKKFG